MKRTKQDYLNLLDETVEYYKTNERGVDDSICAYYTSEGNMCAIGRCLKNPKEIENKVGYGTGLDGDVIILFNEFNPNEILKEEYKGFDVYFWEELQSFHDCIVCWNKTKSGYELNEKGRVRYNNIKAEIKNYI